MKRSEQKRKAYATEIIGEGIVWNGENTEEVVRFCVGWDSTLCFIFREFTNLLTGERTLEIEPGDTMRYCSLDIPLNKRAVRKSKGYRHWIEVQ